MGKIAERNKQILMKYDEGASAGSLASEHGLSEKTVKDIINRTRRRQLGPGQDKLMDDINEKEKELDRIRKIRVGDIVKVRHDTIDAMGYKQKKPITGTVIHKNQAMITVRGAHYAESFSFFDLASDLVEHIPS